MKCRRLSLPKIKIMLSHVSSGHQHIVVIDYIKRQLKLEINKHEVSYLRGDPK